MQKSRHVSGELEPRKTPRIYQYSYFSLKVIRKEVISFSNHIAQNQEKYKILDMGCGNKPYCQFFYGYQDYIGTDLIAGPYVDIVCDNDSLPFDDSSFDYLLCNQVLEHTRNIHGAIREMRRVVKPGGFLLVSLPFLYPEHACPWDYYRFTRFGMQEIFKDFEIVSMKNDTSYFTTLALFINILFTKGKIVRLLFSPFFLVVNGIAWILDFLFIGVLYNFLLLRKLPFFRSIVENSYKQFTSNYILLLKNVKD